MSDRQVPQEDQGQRPGTSAMPAEFRLFFDHYFPVAKDLVTNTGAFFEEMPEEFSLKDAAIFASVGLTIQGIMAKLIQFNIIAIPGNVVLTFATAGLLSAIFFGLAKAQGGKGDIENTAKVVCYSTLVCALSWFPLLGVLPGLYGGYLCAVGLSKVHDFDMKKACVTVFVPSFFIFGAMFVLQLLEMMAKRPGG